MSHGETRGLFRLLAEQSGELPARGETFKHGSHASRGSLRRTRWRMSPDGSRRANA